MGHDHSVTIALRVQRAAMTFAELREATLRLSWGDRWRLLWELGRSLVMFRETLPPTVVERMGGLPQHWLQAGDLADRDLRRAALADRLNQSSIDQS